MGELIMLLLHARTAAHVLHLKTRSYAAHKALQEFYDAIPDLADSIAETYQGSHGLIESYPSKYTAYTDGLALMDDLRSWIQENRFECCKRTDTHIQNIIDEVVALINSTSYKLKFLK